MFAVPEAAWGNLQPSPNPLARFKWAAYQRGGEGIVERGGGKRKETKGKGGIGKGGVALPPRYKFLRAPTLQFITKLVYRWKTFHRMFKDDLRRDCEV